MLKNYVKNINTLTEEEINNTPLILIVSLIKKSFIQYLNKKLENEEINTGEFIFLLALHEEDKISQKELSDRLQLSEGLTTRVLKKLETINYIKREIDKTNKRQKIITLTPKGKTISRKLKEYETQWEEENFKHLNKNLKIELHNGLKNSRK